MKITLRLAAALAFALLFVFTGGAAPSAPSHVGYYERYAVAADHPVASAIGAEVLEAGGNAADAAAATMLALGVASPASSGFGGGGFALYYRASDQSVTFLDFRETAPAAATPTMFESQSASDAPGTKPSQYGGLATGVPGEPAGIAELSSRFGRLPLAQVVAPAIQLARRGVPVSAYVARASARSAAQLRADPIARAFFPPRSEGGLVEGQRLRQPALARTLSVFARLGPEGFYRGRIAAAVVADNRAAGGILTLEDLAAYRVVTRPPLEARRFGYRWVTAPPPSAGGYTILASLDFLERVDPRRELPTWAALHAMAESWKGPALDRQRYFGDPDHVDVPLAAMSAEPRLAARAALFERDRAVPTEAYSMPIEPPSPVAPASESGTSHLCVVDAEGNVASITTTVNLGFGARYTAAGVLMNDEMDDFASAVGQANAFGVAGGARNLPGPGRRPVSSMSPTIVFDDRGPVLCVGASGGSRIPSAVEQVAMDVLVDHLDVEWAIERARVHHQGLPDVLYTERLAPASAAERAYFEQLGYTLDTLNDVANAQLVRIRRGEGTTRIAASDPRKGGRPAGR
jgi:gamma-glutamyltranspeptidase/glutathione hydrolase